MRKGIEMKHAKIGFAVLFLGAALAAAGCGKKATNDQANVTGAGFDSLTNNEELSQLPQATTTANQQGAIEVLPVETSPVTPAAGTAAAQMSTTAASSAVASLTDAVSQTALNHQQKIQTALKNAGFYNGPIDGKIGPGSRKAIQVFQEKNGLKADGKVGPKTWAALERYSNSDNAAATAQSAQTTVSQSAAPKTS